MVAEQSTDLITFTFIDRIPLFVLYIIAVLLLLLAAEGGFRLSRYMQRRSPDRAESVVGALNGATLALLAFLLAFVISIAVNSFSARREAVVSEANAIGTTYLRAGYLPEPYAAESRELLREYVDIRVDTFLTTDIEQVAPAIMRSEEIHNELWARAEALAAEMATPTISLYIASLNEVIDLHTVRIHVGLVARVPPAVVWGIFIIALLAMGIVGLHAGYAKQRNLVALTTLILILAVVFALIADLDRGAQGLMQISPQSLIDLQRQVNAGQ